MSQKTLDAIKKREDAKKPKRAAPKTEPKKEPETA